MKKIVGYTAGVFDMFHIGHLNILKEAKQNCDYLIVGVSTDELVELYKNKTVIIPFEERMEIIRAIRYVDLVIPQVNMNKVEIWNKYKFDKMFVGEDWKGSTTWNELEKQFMPLGVEIIYVKRKYEITSTALRDKIINLN